MAVASGAPALAVPPAPPAAAPPSVPESAPLPAEGEVGVLPEAPPEPAAWPGERFSVASAASAANAAMVLLPEVGLSYAISFIPYFVHVKCDLRVDSSDHASLAMLALRAVEPHGLVIGNTDGVCQDLAGSGERSVGRHETREEGVGLVGHHLRDGHAGVIKGGLDDRVVLRW